MSHKKGVLDTSAVLRLHELEPDDLPIDSAITAVTLAELSVGPLLAEDDEVRAARLAQVQRAETDYGEPIPFGDPITDQNLELPKEELTNKFAAPSSVNLRRSVLINLPLFPTQRHRVALTLRCRRGSGLFVQLPGVGLLGDLGHADGGPAAQAGDEVTDLGGQVIAPAVLAGEANAATPGGRDVGGGHDSS